jgi:hypothetical protein
VGQKRVDADQGAVLFEFREAGLCTGHHEQPADGQSVFAKIIVVAVVYRPTVRPDPNDAILVNGNDDT